MKFKGSIFRSTIFKGYASTYVVEFFVLISNLLIYSLATDFFGEEGWAKLSVFKRIFAFIQPVLLFGLLIGITRFVAQTNERSVRFSYLLSTYTFFALIAIFLIFILNYFSSFWTNLLFQDGSYEVYILPLAISIAGIYFHLMIYGYLRGSHEFVQANYLQFFNMSLIPVLAFFTADSLDQILLITGLSWACLSTLYLGYLMVKNHGEFKLEVKISRLKQLMRYGVPRVPGDIAFGALFALPIILVAHFESTEVSERLAFSLTLLNIVGAAFSPLSLMLLPTISQKLKNKQWFAVRKEIKRAIVATLVLSGLGVLIYELFAFEIMTWYLGEEIGSSIQDTKVIMLGGVFYALFITLRSVIDAYHEKAINSMNLVISVTFFCLGAFLISNQDLSYLWYYKVFLLSLLLLVSLTLFSVYRIQSNLRKSN